MHGWMSFPLPLLLLFIFIVIGVVPLLLLRMATQKMWQKQIELLEQQVAVLRETNELLKQLRALRE